MKIITKDLYYQDWNQEFTLYHLTDLHIGGKTCAEKRLQDDINVIKSSDEFTIWTGGGDYIDAICQAGDRRFSPAVLASWVMNAMNDGDIDIMGIQRNKAVEYLSPIMDKCVGLGKGNHEWAAETWYARDVWWEMVDRLAQVKGVPPENLGFGSNGFIVLNFRYGTPESFTKSWRFVIYIHHGYGGGNLAGGHALTLERALGNFDANLIMMGHRHVRSLVDKVVTSPWGYRQSTALFVPSYQTAHIIPAPDKRSVDTYADKFGLPPKPLGTIPIKIKPSERKFSVIMSTEGPIDWEARAS